MEGILQEVSDLLSYLSRHPDDPQSLYQLEIVTSGLNRYLVDNTYSTDLPLLAVAIFGQQKPVNSRESSSYSTQGDEWDDSSMNSMDRVGEDDTQKSLLDILKPIAGEKNLSSFLGEMCRFLYLVISETNDVGPDNKVDEDLQQHRAKAVQSLCDGLYFRNPAAKVKVEALKLNQACIEKWSSCYAGDQAAKLAHKYFLELAKSSKLSSTVSSQLHQLLGRMTERFPVDLKEMAERLLNSFTSELKTKMKSQTEKLDLTLLEGTVKGVNYILSGHGLDETSDIEILETLYDVLRRLCRRPDREATQVTQRGAMRAGLDLMAAHATGIFARYLLNDAKYWFPELRVWCDAAHSEDHKAGWRAMMAFLEAVGTALEATTGLSREKVPAGFQFMLSQLKLLLLEKGTSGETRSTLKQVSLAVQGYGHLAKPLHKVLSEDDYVTLCQDIVSQLEQIHLVAPPDRQNRYQLELANHVRAMTMLIEPLLISTTDSSSQSGVSLAYSLEALSVDLAKKFSHYPPQYHGFAIAALGQVIKLSFSQPGTKTIYENIIYQTLLESCSHPVIAEADLTDNDVITYRKFLPLWKGLLAHSREASVDASGALSQQDIFSEFVRGVISIIDKLDLSVIFEEDQGIGGQESAEETINVSLTQTEEKTMSNAFGSEGSTTVSIGVKRANVVKDFTVLVNLVDVTSILFKQHPKLASAWSLELWQKISVWSYEHPDVSSFYRLAAVLLEIYNNVSTPANDKVFDNVRCILTDFLEDLLLKVANFHQAELKLSAFSLITVIPNQFVSELLPQIANIYPHILKLGYSVPELGQSALKALLNWILTHPESTLQGVLTQAMPCLTPFLAWREKADEEAAVSSSKMSAARVKKSDKEKLRRHLAGQGQSLEKKNCHLAMRLLAAVSLPYKMMVFPKDEHVGKNATRWDHRQHLKVDLPLPDASVPLHLDNLLPVNLQLVTSSTDRKTRVAAAEVLHGIFVVMIGKTSQQSEDIQKKHPMTALFKHVIPVVMSLAMDADTVIQELFRPIFLQSIHWFTKNRTFESPETTCLLNCLLDTICSNEDAHKREEAAGFLQEFVEWSIKQAGANSKRSGNIKSILVRLHYLWRHPDVNKRTGACLAFNKLYRPLREEEGLVSQFLLEVLVSIMTSFRLSHADNQFCGTVELLRKNLEQVKRILFRYIDKGLFNSCPDDRRVPSELAGGTVDALLAWLFKCASLSQTEARHRAMELFQQLAPRCSRSSRAQGPTPTSEFGSWKEYIATYEERIPDLKQSCIPFGTVDEAKKCLESLQTALENWIWLLEMQLCTVDEILRGSTKVEEIINFVVNNCGNIDKPILLKSSTARSAKEIQKEVLTTITRMYTFLNWMIKEDKGPSLIKSGGAFCKLIMSTILESEILGFTFKSKTDRTQFSIQYINLLKTIKTKWPSYFSDISKFYQKLYLTSEPYSLSYLMKTILNADVDSKAIACHTELSQNGLFDVKHDAEEFLEILLNALPSDYHALSRLSATQIDNVSTALSFIVTVVDDFIVRQKLFALLLSNDPKSLWVSSKFFFLFSDMILEDLDNFFQVDGSLKGFKYINSLINSAAKSRNPIIRKRIVNVVLENWEEISGNILSRTDILKTVQIVKHLSTLDCFTDKQNQICKWYCNMLQHPSIDVKVKYKALTILDVIIYCCESHQLKNSLLQFSSLHFPAMSCELIEGSLSQNIYKSIIMRVLTALENSASPDLLYLIISVACRESDHLCEEEISNVLTKMMAKASTEQQLAALNVPWEIFGDVSGTYSHSVKLICLSKFAINLLAAASGVVISRFFDQHMETFLKDLSIEIRGSAESRTSILVKKIGIVKLFDVLYSKLHSSMLHAQGGILVCKAVEVLKKTNLFPCKNDGKELTTYLLKILIDGRKEVEQDGASEELKAMYRSYHCASLNAVISIISCTQVTEKLFSLFIFQEKKSKNELIWSRIVDKNAKFDLPLEMEEVTARKKHLVTVRQSIFSHIDENPIILSHYLADSSLSQDLTSYDFTSSLSLGQTTVRQSHDRGETSHSHYIELENDSLGKHPCMAQLVACANLMKNKGIYQIPNDSSNKSEIPLWMKPILSALNDQESNRNVKLFLLKFIYNCSDIFRPFAHSFYKAILVAISDGTLDPDNKLNYMTIDLLIMLLSWSEATQTQPDADASEKMAVSRVFMNLMKNVYHEEKKIFKLNLELIDYFLKLWGKNALLNFDYDILESMMISSVKEACGAAKLLSIFLANSLGSKGCASSPNFVKKLVSMYKSKFKEVYEAAAKATGYLLLSLNEDEKERPADFIIQSLKSLAIANSVEDKRRFLYVLHGIQSKYPKILEHFSSNFVYSLQAKTGEELSLCLEMVMNFCPVLTQDTANLSTEFSMIGIKTFLERQDFPNQKIALQIVKSTIEHFEDKMLEDYLTILDALATNANLEIRYLVQEIFIKVDKREGKQYQDVCTLNLLRGLSDPNDKVKQLTFSYLTSTKGVPRGGFDKIKYWFSHLYHQKHESTLLHSLPVALLKACEESTQYKSKLFADPLDECVFVEYDVNTNWRQQHNSSFLPMYADTLASQSDYNTMSIVQTQGAIRATQKTRAFSQTLVDDHPQALPQASEHKNVTNAGSQISSLAVGVIQLGNMVAGKRFARREKNFDLQKAYFSRLAAQDNLIKERIEEDQKKVKRNVTLMRKYRKGDLPDIQISFEELLGPLVNLCHMNASFAQVIFYELVKSVIDINQDLLEDADNLQELSHIIDNIIGLSVAENTSFIASILEICYHLSYDLSLSTKKISELSANPSLINLGILLLEKIISNQKDTSSTKLKKRRKLTPSDTGMAESWIQLTDMYRLGHENENMIGVFMQGLKEINSHDKTSEALNFEANGDWNQALKTYRVLLENEELVSSHLEQEIGLWYRGYYDSHAKLGKWEQLYDLSTDVVKQDKLEKKPYYPNIVNALMLSGMHLGIGSSQYLDDVYAFINSQVKDKNIQEEFLKEHSLPLSVLLASRGKYMKALSIVRIGCEQLKETLFSSSMAFTGQTAKKVMSLHAFIELELILKQALHISHDENDAIMWNQLPLPDDDLVHWDTILTVRSLCNCQNREMEVDDSLGKNEMSLAKGYIALSHAAVNQSNSLYAQRGLRKVKLVSERSKEVAFAREQVKAKVAILNFHKRTDLTASDNFCSVFKISNQMEDNDMIKKDIYKCLYNIVNDNSHLTPSQIRRQLKSHKDVDEFAKFNFAEDTNESFKEKLVKKVLGSFDNIMSGKLHVNADEQRTFLESAFSFHYQLVVDSNFESSINGEAYVEYHLKAIKYGSHMAKDLFPQILNVLDKIPSTAVVFCKEQTSVPSWMFLAWCNQLISALHNDSISDKVYPLVERIAEEHPNAVLYTVQTCHDNPDLSDTALYLFEMLKKKIYIAPVHKTILHHLNLVTSPFVALGDIRRSFETNKMNYPNSYQQMFAAAVEEFQNQFVKGATGRNTSHGLIHRQFAKDYGKDVATKDYEKIRQLCADQEKFERKYLNSGMLKDFSPFLAEYLSSSYEDKIEIPGQYSVAKMLGQTGRPDPKRHVHIASFEPNVRVFASKGKPVLISLIGTDGQRYRFVLKAGEDLRQDQRIETLFEICNIMLNQKQAHSQIAVRKIVTYDVIPLTDRLGLIGFVDNTLTLKEFTGQLCRNANHEHGKAEAIYKTGISNLAKQSGQGISVVESFKNAGQPSPSDIVHNFHAAIACMDKNHLHNALQMKSMTFEGFYYLRKNFITSYAVLSVMQWILGIGDRHTSNYLVCQLTGRVVTIDFGYAFGVATSHLPVPELVQVRLTPQILGLMEPLGTHGLFRETMVSVLSTLRDNPDVLMAALSSFIQEPTVDWLNAAAIEARALQKDCERWREQFPMERVGMVRDKLDGGNPTELTRRELSARVKGPNIRKLICHVEGDRLGQPGQRQGGLWPSLTDLTASQQVDCLIHQSTDPNLLGRMWVGWSPFF